MTFVCVGEGDKIDASGKMFFYTPPSPEASHSVLEVLLFVLSFAFSSLLIPSFFLSFRGAAARAATAT